MTSNPSKAYVKRISDVFNNSGNPQGRGDMRAVIQAILLDPEARANDTGLAQVNNDGHLQEPALYLAGIIRAFGGTVNDQNYWAYELLTSRRRSTKPLASSTITRRLMWFRRAEE